MFLIGSISVIALVTLSSRTKSSAGGTAITQLRRFRFYVSFIFSWQLLYRKKPPTSHPNSTVPALIPSAHIHIFHVHFYILCIQYKRVSFEIIFQSYFDDSLVTKIISYIYFRYYIQGKKKIPLNIK